MAGSPAFRSNQWVTDWFSGDIVANGIQTHYYRSGGDKPPLVLLHGATDNGLCWAPIARHLTADYDVVLPDARGHGKSAAPTDGYSSVERAADVADLIRGLGLGQPAVGGHSMGGQTTFRLGVDHPDLVRCAILEDPPFRSVSPATEDPVISSVRDRMRAELAEHKQRTREQVIAAGREAHPKWAEDELPAWADAKLQVSGAFMGALRDEPAWTDLVPRLQCPVLLVTADTELGAIVSPEGAEAAQRKNPNIQVVRLTGAGHNIRREQSEGFLNAVRGFLARHYPLVARV
jgi:pimeloyl-ACP methyl ester carboxylesterase